MRTRLQPMGEAPHRDVPAPKQLYTSVRIYQITGTQRYIYQHCRVYDIRQHDPRHLESGCITAAHGGLNGERPLALDSLGHELVIRHYPGERPAARQALDLDYERNREERHFPAKIAALKEAK